MIGHILFEGSSTTAGYGDEAEKMGYAGRLHYRYIRYGRLAQRSEKTPPCSFAYTHLSGSCDNIVINYAHQLPQHAEAARNLSHFTSQEIRIIGVFAVGGLLDDRTKLLGKKGILVEWEKSLRSLEKTCLVEGIRPVVVSTPMADEYTRLPSGKPPDLEMHREQMAIAGELIPKWAPYTTFEAIVDEDRDSFIADDHLHPNAAGHVRIARHLARLIDAELEINTAAFGDAAAQLAFGD